MPNCFTLTRKSNLEAGPVSLNKIDEEICGFLGVPVDPVKYCRSWFDIIGGRLALGRSFEEMRANFVEKQSEDTHKDFWGDILQIVDFLAEHFTPDAWYEPK